MPAHSAISRVILRNYKSIRSCDVKLGQLTFLVGPNGSGKSNFLEALRLLSFGLVNGLEDAVANRSGFRSIFFKGMAERHLVCLDISVDLGDDTKGHYIVEIEEAAPDGPVVVAREECSVESPGRKDWFKVRGGIVDSNQGVMPAASKENFYLANATGFAAFAPLHQTLSRIPIYNPVPDAIRGFKPAKRMRLLDRTASNLAETIFNLKASGPERLSRIAEYLRRITPNVLSVSARTLDDNYNLRFVMETSPHVREDFQSQNISDGTLRALAVLVALFQKIEGYTLDVIALEEPEAGLHPAAAGVLFDSLVEGSHLRQVIVTSHSPDLLDREDIPANALKVVIMEDGRTIIGEADEVGKKAMREHLYTAGELMRMGQLRPVGTDES